MNIMPTPNLELMRNARESLTGKWGLAVGTFFIYALIIVLIPFAGLILAGPLSMGLAIFSMSIARKEDAKFDQLFEGFNHFGNSLGAYLLILIFTFLWSLLLIIPGIIAAISYSMTFFILADDPTIDGMSAIDKSKEMMYGYKLKYFFLLIRFIGWAILCFFTFGIGVLFLRPFMQVSFAKFYEDIKDNPIPNITN